MSRWGDMVKLKRSRAGWRKSQESKAGKRGGDEAVDRHDESDMIYRSAAKKATDFLARWMRRVHVLNTSAPYALEHMPHNDPLAIEMLLRKSTKDFMNLPEWVRGCNWNTFQRTLRDITPGSVDDIAVAFMLSQDWAIKQGARHVYVLHGTAGRPAIDPLLEPATRTTRGMFLYGEQVVEALQQVTGFSSRRANGIRRALHYYSSLWCEEEREAAITQFLEATMRRGIPRKRAELIMKAVIDTKGTLSSRSHSLEYANLIYRAAYMKTHFPKEAWA